MKRLGEKGGIAAIVVSTVLGLLLLGVSGFAVWAYQGRQDYKNNVDSKIVTAVDTAKKQQKYVDSKKFAEDEKQPLRPYKGPAAYGSIIVNYPKTWSAYVDDSGRGNAVVDGYFQPSAVQSISDQNSVFALRVQVVSQSYSDAVSALSNLQTTSKLKIAPFSLKQVPSVVGIRADGQIAQNKTGSMIILPLRDKTLEISSEAPEFQNDFDNNILPYFTFSP